MDTSKKKIRHILQFFFDKGENASQAAENVNSVYGPDTVTTNHAQFWFRRFRSGNFDVKDALRSGSPIVENVDKINGNRRVRPSYRISICELLLNRNKINPFLKRMVTDDEKWVTYDNIKRKKSWSNRGEPAQTVAKPGLTVRKVLLCVHANLAPSDYHLFLSMANDFASEKFASREACENRLSQFFANRDEGFYERGIMELPLKWQQVIEQNGAYLT
ncbi:PREDICTED: histone-lysine N-methyltransferase SETMAR-like [Acromyrmex echinatior]|uniref:histone-lysine N-methyltransferase SETMAR-like n=1 Tax=Acromyrmex echinatior TaxID=103372 RepID=UPI000580FF31|nr:PREDICTED: histone-lysine N-methyltransferase SETMAR-like [Acromyrmex echinatior]